MKISLIMSMLMVLFISTGETAAERKVIRVGVRPSAPPFCFLSQNQGKVGLRGINIDLMSQIEKYLRVKMEYISCSGIEQRQHWLSEGRVDVIALVSMEDIDSVAFHSIPVDFSLNRRLFVHESCKTIVCARDLSNKQVVTIAGDPYHPFVGEVDQDNLIVVRTPLEALQLLNKGLVDAFLAPSDLIAQYLVQTEQLEHVVMVGVTLQRMPLALAVRAENDELFEELSRAVEYLNRSGALQLIKDKWYGVVYQPTSWRRYSKVIFISVSTVIFIMLAVFAWNFQLKRKVRKVTRDLQNSENKYRNLIETSPDMIFVVDQQGRIETANQEARMMIHEAGSKNDQERYLYKYVIPDEYEKLKKFLASVFNGQSGSSPFHFVYSSGETRDMDVAAVRISSGVTDEGMACFFVRDVTERKRMEQELIQADRLATIGKMAAGIAHEINNPIGIVRANIELIRTRGWFAEEAREFVESIRRNTLRAGKITQDLLAIAKPKTPEMTEVDLCNLIDLTLALLNHQLKGVEIDFAPSQNPVWVLGDRNLLQQVLVNVFLNAVTAMKDNLKRKMLITFCSPPGADAACLRIEDNGEGIPKKYLNEIFEAFFTYGKLDGFGLGLFICRRIIEHHDGMIFAESEEGRGTQIVIELPLIKGPRQASIWEGMAS
ncbi:MAG: transporter substrate-binding domain-containing protein [Deltaproteobacteria bacterium]|nr:transporter substrate-binding domain-containing protein [Deltaproteobacteria bacterium]